MMSMEAVISSLFQLATQPITLKVTHKITGAGLLAYTVHNIAPTIPPVSKDLTNAAVAIVALLNNPTASGSPVTIKTPTVSIDKPPYFNPPTITNRPVDGTLNEEDGSLKKKNLTQSEKISYDKGEFKITPQHQLKLKSLSTYFNYLSKHNKKLLIEAVADFEGNDTLFDGLQNQPCVRKERFEDIFVHKYLGNGKYSNNLTRFPLLVGNHYDNSHLPQLRGRVVQCYLKNMYPDLQIELLEGSVESFGPDFRNTRLFESNNGLVNEERIKSMIPPSD
jgi:hypothetical protein